MCALAVQAAVGGIGEKATTILDNYQFNSLIEINGVSLGANSEGLYVLNSGDKDDSIGFTSTVRFAATDFGIHNFKRIRFLYIGVDTSNPFKVKISVDNQEPEIYSIKNQRSGLQRVHVPINRSLRGRYWTVEIISSNWFRIDDIKLLPVILSSGMRY